jgi:hypothetical protein
MLIKSVYLLVAAVLFGLFPAAPGFATDAPYSGDLGSSKWFEMMRKAGFNSAMLRALAGSNGQIAIPPDCVEISGVFTVGRGEVVKGKVPTLRILSTDDRVDNVPRTPFITQSANEPPNFYTVLKRELTYEFYWLDNQGRDEQFATWRVPADAPKQVRLIFTIEPGAKCRISVFNEQRPAAK